LPQWNNISPTAELHPLKPTDIAPENRPFATKEKQSYSNHPFFRCDNVDGQNPGKTTKDDDYPITLGFQPPFKQWVLI